ncbi:MULTISPECIES: MBL fold metallo-hydrolase [Rhizobium/Agrobacterium group]|uniref:MBL fold metallo-hydrolase n=1 Tax=Rhizobium/Agrobacterium group TaxID=227290 RepID=UPI00102F84A6|nr:MULTISPECIES: MBL fold metallo-hydrolase [Rhizobium/Agrobacterium group]TBH46083.1 MBL fold metallo-hydrolase [Rhizobium leguminosarum]
MPQFSSRFVRKPMLAVVATLAIGTIALPQVIEPVLAAAPMQKVQSGYLHVMVGKFEVTALSDGTLDLPVETLLAEPENATKAALTRAYLSSPTETSVNAFLVNTGQKLILIDTGAGKLLGPDLGKLADNVKAAGYSLDQIDDVVITHLHLDHVGGLMRDGKQVFPKAVIHADKADTDYWLSEDARRKDGDQSNFFAGAVASLRAYVQSGQLKPFTGDTEIAPGLTAISAHGHTPGHVIYEVESDGKRMFVIGDLIHVAAVQFDEPGVTIGFDSDQSEARTTRHAVFAKIAKEGDLVGASHLSFPGVGHIRPHGEAYEWIPLNYSLGLSHQTRGQ